MTPKTFLLALLVCATVYLAGFFMPEGMGKNWYLWQVIASCACACMVITVAHNNNNVCKPIVTIVGLELILAGLYLCACTEYTLAEIAVKAGKAPAVTALFDDNILVIERTFSVVIGLILTTGAPWGGILDGLHKLAGVALSGLGSLGERFVDAYPDHGQREAYQKYPQAAHQSCQGILQGSVR